MGKDKKDKKCKDCGHSQCKSSSKQEQKVEQNIEVKVNLPAQGACNHCKKRDKGDHCACDHCKKRDKNDHCACDHCRKRDQKSCNDSLNELIASAADIENALANAINAESSILKEGNFTPEQLLLFTNRLENLLKLSIKKEIILEFLIEDAIKACKVCRKCKDQDYDC